MSFLQNWFRQLPTAGKLLLLLSAAILPLGLVLVAAASNGIEQANSALSSRANDQGRLAVRAIDSLIARNVLALRIAANGALDGGGDPCERVTRALGAAPGTPSSFLLSDPIGTQLCTRGEPDDGGRRTLLVAPGQVRMWLVPERGRLFYKVGVFGGSATGSLDREQFRSALSAARAGTAGLDLIAGGGALQVSDEGERSGALGSDPVVERFTQKIAGGQVEIAVDVPIDHIASADRLLLLLPVLMWIVAALLSWLVVRTFLLTPLHRISQSIAAHEPGQGPLQLPERLGPSVEIRELGASFTRAVERIEQSERDMGEALEGQRKLVREVHHRVKNNLQVVASLLNIHRRSAKSEDAQNAYSAIGRRVDALAVVHRNHFAELEENRGIALRPLISELASNLRGSAPESARRLDINLDLESLNTTQDVAVATAFLTTEIVEHAMLTRPDAPVTLTLRRSGDLTARFTLATGALSPEIANQAEHQQFERIITGLAKQLRSALERTEGHYSVELPVFAARESY
ncbi:sensor histidine kinase [Sphingomonas kaistensis]|uniref:histidine kinase n=1 Tax=Sphingomonas kaistensis TaxID=298708 RepID=A0ABZ2G2C4_9SPHN